ncbi:MAG: hypothetical protein ACI3YK_05280 [Eubacteriales bacterium]
MKRKLIATLLITGLLASGLSVFAFAATTDNDSAEPESTSVISSETASTEETEAKETVVSDVRPGMTEKRIQALAEQQEAENDPVWLAAKTARLAVRDAHLAAAAKASPVASGNVVLPDAVINYGMNRYEDISSDLFLVANVAFTNIGGGNPQLLNACVDYDVAGASDYLSTTTSFAFKTQLVITYNGGSSTVTLTDTSDSYTIGTFTDGYANYSKTFDLSGYKNITQVYVFTRIVTTDNSLVYYPLTLQKTIAQILAQGNG